MCCFIPKPLNHLYFHIFSTWTCPPLSSNIPHLVRTPPVLALQTMIQCLPMMLFQLIHALLATMMCAPGWTWRRQWDNPFWAQAYGHQILLGNTCMKSDTWIFTFVALPKNIITMKTWTLWNLVIGNFHRETGPCLVMIFLFKVFIEWVLLYVEKLCWEQHTGVFSNQI